LVGDEINLLTFVPPATNRVKPEGEKSSPVELKEQVFCPGFKQFSDVLGKLWLDVRLEYQVSLTPFDAFNVWMDKAEPECEPGYPIPGTNLYGSTGYR
jgi:hypothetical protein